MNQERLKKGLATEVFFRATRSSGKGGQHVNKVATRVEAWWDIYNSHFLTPEQKELLFAALEKKVHKDGHIIVVSSETRSQLQNKEIAFAKLLEMVEKALTIPKERKPTRPSKAVIERRKQAKQRQAEKKQWRRGLFD